MEQNKYDFNNVAVECDTWEQMCNLMVLARRSGETVKDMNIEQFEEGANIFSAFTSSNAYTNFWEPMNHETLIPYATFISNPAKQ